MAEIICVAEAKYGSGAVEAGILTLCSRNICIEARIGVASYSTF